MRTLTYSFLTAACAIVLPLAGAIAQPPQGNPASIQIDDETRVELLAARDAVWRAFFADDLSQLDGMLGPELIAIQQHQEKWENKTDLLKMARLIREQGVKITEVKFPRTEVQLFGDVAILYYTYVFGTAGSEWAVSHEGRGTEIFVRRDGKWVDVGWHLDNGAFRQRGESWQRMGAMSTPKDR